MRYVRTPLGSLLVEGDDAIFQIRFVADAEGGAHDDIAEQLREYFTGDRTAFDFDIDLVGTEFQVSVWEEVMQIPYGETRTYLEIAQALGDPNLARAVGTANGANPLLIVVPCHRVVGADGELTGYAAGLERKRWLLDHESAQGRLFGK